VDLRGQKDWGRNSTNQTAGSKEETLWRFPFQLSESHRGEEIDFLALCQNGVKIGSLGEYRLEAVFVSIKP
jgi:hypothetical protein